MDLKDKIVLVGATAVGIFDLRVTPFGTVFPGLEIHANIIDSILARDFLHKPGWAAMFDALAILMAGLFLGIFLPRTGAVSGALTATIIFFISNSLILIDIDTHNPFRVPHSL